jgi:hypothetical protein
LQYAADFIVKYNGADNSMYMKQDLQATENNKTLLSLYLHKIVAMPALEHLIIITILMVGEKGKT